MKSHLSRLALLCLAISIAAGCSKNSAPTPINTTLTPVTPPPVTPQLPHFVINTGAGSFIVDSLGGAVTQNEINAFVNYMNGYAKPTVNDGNQWVFGNLGKALEACGLMYDTIRNNPTNNIGVLDRMI